MYINKSTLRDLQKMQVEKDSNSTRMAKQFMYLMDGGISSSKEASIWHYIDKHKT